MEIFEHMEEVMMKFFLNVERQKQQSSLYIYIYIYVL